MPNSQCAKTRIMDCSSRDSERNSRTRESRNGAASQRTSWITPRTAKTDRTTRTHPLMGVSRAASSHNPRACVPSHPRAAAKATPTVPRSASKPQRHTSKKSLRRSVCVGSSCVAFMAFGCAFLVVWRSAQVVRASFPALLIRCCRRKPAAPTRMEQRHLDHKTDLQVCGYARLWVESRK